MNDVPSGFSDIIVNVVDGLVVGILIASFRTMPGMESYSWYFDTIGLIGFAAFVIAIPQWSIGYIIGWAFGAWVLWEAGLMHLQEIITYIVIPAIILVSKLYLMVKGQS